MRYLFHSKDNTFNAVLVSSFFHFSLLSVLQPVSWYNYPLENTPSLGLLPRWSLLLLCPPGQPWLELCLYSQSHTKKPERSCQKITWIMRTYLECSGVSSFQKQPLPHVYFLGRKGSALPVPLHPMSAVYCSRETQAHSF